MCRRVGENEARKNGFQRPLHSYQILVWCTIVISIILFLTVVIPFHPDNLTLWVTGAIYAFCFCLGFTNFMWVSLTDPRTLRTKDTIGASVAGDAVPLKSLSSSTPPDTQNSSTPSLPTAEEYIECTKCPALKLPDTKHCNLCQKCVDNFDHHCVYLNTCIGKENYWSFFTVISCLTAFLAIQLYVTIDWITRYYLKEQDYVDAVASSSLTGHGQILLGLITTTIPAGGFGLISSLEGFHIWIIILRTTTYKWILDRRRRRAEEAYQREQRKKGITSETEQESLARDEARKKEWQEKMDKEKEERKKKEERRIKMEEREQAKRDAADQSQIDEPSAKGGAPSRSQASVDLSGVQIHNVTRSDGPPRDEAVSLIDTERSSSHHTKGDSAAISIHVSPSRRRDSSTEIVTNDGREDEDAAERRLSMLGVATLDEVGHDKVLRPGGTKLERHEKRKSDESTAEASEFGSHTTATGWTKQSDRD